MQTFVNANILILILYYSYTLYVNIGGRLVKGTWDVPIHFLATFYNYSKIKSYKQKFNKLVKSVLPETYHTER